MPSVTCGWVGRYNQVGDLFAVRCVNQLRQTLMLDLLGILVSGIMMVVVALRAVQLDASKDWFQRSKPKAENATADRPVAEKTGSGGYRAN